MLKVRGSDFNKIWARLPCCFPEGPLKRDFLDIYPTTFFGIRNFRNTADTRVILNKLSVFQIIASELAASICLY